VRSAIDTNVISSLWSGQPASDIAEKLLLSAREDGGLVICGAVYAELLARPSVDGDFLDKFLAQTGIDVEFELEKNVWQQAGFSFSKYARRRKVSKGGEPRRILADFLIGAHALHRAQRLLTFNPADYKQDFPGLVVQDRPVSARNRISRSGE
jgi:predicted nucleic acid-binding protein